MIRPFIELLSNSIKNSITKENIILYIIYSLELKCKSKLLNHKFASIVN